MTTNADTKLLLARWHEGDAAALHALVQAHLSWIEARVRLRLGPMLRARAETADFVQEAVIDVLQYGPRFVVSDPDQFRGLLARIVENTLRDRVEHFAAKKRDAARERALPSDTVLALDPPRQECARPSEAASARESAALLELALCLLDPGDREVIVLRQKDDLAFAEIGRRLGIAEDAARFRFHRALPRLARCMEQLQRGEVDGALRAAGEAPES
jgi:RNA polymerase sigma factor (sigma-70 family)